MNSENFVLFKARIPEEALPQIAAILSDEIPAFAEAMCGDPNKHLEDHLDFLFKKVGHHTGQFTKKESSGDEYLTNLVTNSWPKLAKRQGGSKRMLLATYYYLHLTNAGKPIAQRVDQAVFGHSFEDAIGAIPGACLDNDIPIHGTEYKDHYLENLDELSDHHKKPLAPPTPESFTISGMQGRWEIITRKIERFLLLNDNEINEIREMMDNISEERELLSALDLETISHIIFIIRFRSKRAFELLEDNIAP
ncbi:hypothetical protein [Citromicrobium bathyomarinum]|uniref:hypothetical protein n=1 Tax=Citromicrobium bathyomarinum TaxID=72174 RepID=UPI001E40AFC4|nr:hypothetical protein [Citromicrobium bathyomarinum]MCD1624026.1 hypothetical protein [Citromicrobium bathyomarinum]